MKSNAICKFIEQHQRLLASNLTLALTGINIMIPWHLNILGEKWNEMFSLSITLKQTGMKQN